jgi:rare lipoprotein A
MKRFLASAISALLMCGIASAASSLDAVSPKSGSPNPVRSRSVKEASKATIRASKPTTKSTKVQVGTASWYGKQFHGRQTASGDTYDMFQFTAAHRTLPLGTIVKVTNLRNGKWVIVKVNDRGPYVGHRLVDLSYGAAQMLAFRQRGIEKVKLEVIEPETLAMNVSTD